MNKIEITFKNLGITLNPILKKIYIYEEFLIYSKGPLYKIVGMYEVPLTIEWPQIYTLMKLKEILNINIEAAIEYYSKRKVLK